MNRFFTEDIAGDTARITGEDVKHISRVLRLHVGEQIAVCDGRANEYIGEIISISDAEVRCRVGEAQPSLTESRVRVTLFQGLPKSGKMETIVQKCVELGIDTVVPTLLSRCVAVPTRDFEKKRIRYQRVAEEAAKQSRRGIIPNVTGVVRVQDIDCAAFDTVLVAYEDEHATTLKEVLRAGVGERIAIVIGPEGGFEESEIDFATSCGGKTVSLGKRILRTETAAVTAVGMCMLYSEMNSGEKE